MTSVLDWIVLSGRRAFYLDGRLYFLTESGWLPPGVRGTANSVVIDVASERVTLSDPHFGRSSLKFSDDVRTYHDVGWWLGNTSRVIGLNKLARYRRPVPGGIGSYMAKRTRFGVVDGRIIEDNLGIPGRGSGLGVKPTVSVARADDTEWGSPTAYVFETYNDVTRDKVGSLVFPAAELGGFSVVGRNVAFSSQDEDDEARSVIS